jgi:hypothetical protein
LPGFAAAPMADATAGRLPAAYWRGLPTYRRKHLETLVRVYVRFGTQGNVSLATAQDCLRPLDSVAPLFHSSGLFCALKRGCERAPIIR